MNWRLKPGACLSPSPRRRVIAAFTLIEVLLAVGITAGLLLVVLYFHHQTAALRVGLLEESARLTAARQLMGRLSRELACMAPAEGAFRGDSRSIEFSWHRQPSSSGDPSGIGLEKVTRLRYESRVDEESRMTSALSRRATDSEIAAPSDVEAESGSVYALLDSMSESANTPAGAVTYGAIRFARFRFWDGTEWAEAWEASDPPHGVEVILGFYPADEDVTSEDYPDEMFRRLIPVLALGPTNVVTTGPSLAGPAENADRPDEDAPMPDAPPERNRERGGRP